MSSSLSKSEKERTKLVQEKCQQMLNDLLRDEDNKYCVDCDAKGPRWASWNLGVFLCIRCAGIHRNLGVHISKVKSVNLDTWTPEQVVSMTTMGNSRGRAVYEANIPESFRRPQTDTPLENFIRAKYEHKKYIAKEFIPTPVGKVDWTAEIDEIIASKGRKKAQPSTTPLMFPKLAIPPPGEKRVVHQEKPVPMKPVEKPSDTNFFDLSDILIDTSSNPSGTTTAHNPGVGVDSSELLQELTLTEPEQRKMTKESILSLYGNQQGTQNPFMFQQPPPPVQHPPVQHPPVQNPGSVYNSAPHTNFFN